MAHDTAFIPVSLVETLQPDDVGGLVDYSARHGLSHGEVIARALRLLLSSDKPVPPVAVGSTSQSEAAAAQRAA